LEVESPEALKRLLASSSSSTGLQGLAGGSGYGPARSPSEACERQATVRIECDTLAGEKLTLEYLEARLCAGADLPSGVHHTVPRNSGVARSRKCVADLASPSGHASELRDLAVRGYASAWNA